MVDTPVLGTCGVTRGSSNLPVRMQPECYLLPGFGHYVVRMRQQFALRARLILAMAEGFNNSQIARSENLAIKSVRLWRQQWLYFAPLPCEALTLSERLSDVPRPGAPPTGATNCAAWAMTALNCPAPGNWFG